MGVPVTLQDLITPVSQPTYYNEIIQGHQANGVPWQSWLDSTNNGLSLSQIAAQLFATLSNILVQIAQGLFIDYSAGVPMTLFAQSQYQLARIPAQFTSGQLLLFGAAAGRTNTFSAGQLTVGTPGANSATSRLYTNTESGTLQPGALSIPGKGQGLTLTAKSPGVGVTIVLSGTNTALSVSAAGPNLTITLGTDAKGNPTSTAAQVAAAITGNAPSLALVGPTVLAGGSFVLGALGFTSLAGGALSLNFSATQPGAAWNLPVGSPLVLKTTFPGVSVVAIPWIGGTWITSQGADPESDDRLKVRCVSRWGTLGVGGNEDAFRFWALCVPNGYTSSPVSQVEIFSNFLGTTYAPGAATVCIIGPAGQLAAGDVAAVQQNFENPITSLANAAIPGLDALGKKYPIGCQVQVVSATNLIIPLVGTVSIYRSSNASIGDVQAAVTAALTTYQGTISIGEKLYPQKKIAGVIGQSAPFSLAISEVDLSSMPDSITPTLIQYPLLDASGLIYQLVDV